MSTVNFSVPEDIKSAFNTAFAGQNKSAVITELMREAIERAQAQQRSRSAIERILGRRAKAALRAATTLESARRAGRP